MPQVNLNGASSVNIPSEQSVTQSQYHVDSINGNDANDGATKATAIKTIWGGFVGKVGIFPEWKVSVDFYIYEDLLPTDILYFNGAFAAGVSVRWHGVPKVATIGTVGFVTQQDIPTNQRTQMHVTNGVAIVDIRPYVGKLFKSTNNTGDVYAWLASVQTSFDNGLGNFSQMGQRELSNGLPDGWENLSYPTNGNNVQVLTLPKVYQSFFTPDFPIYNVNSISYMEFLDFRIPAGGLNPTLPPFINAYECHFDSLSCFSNTPSIAINCCFENALIVSTGLFENVLGLVLNAPGLILLGQAAWVCFGMTWQNSSMVCTHNTSIGGVFEPHHNSYGLWVFDSNLSIFELAINTTISFETSFCGSGNTGFILNISNGAYVYFENPGSIKVTTGAASPISIDSQDQLPRIDPTTYTWIHTPLTAVTPANIETTSVGGGFGGKVFDPKDPRTMIVVRGI